MFGFLAKVFGWLLLALVLAGSDVFSVFIAL